MLSPEGAGKVLLQWPHYYLLKSRVFVCLAWCAIACGIGFASISMILLEWHTEIAVGLLIGGVLSAAGATATLAMARVRLRELLSTQSS